MRIGHIVAMTSILCLTISACTTTSQGEPTPTPSSESGVTASTPLPGNEDDLPRNGAPKVRNPLDLSHFEQNPCAALTAAQVQNLKLPTIGKQEEVPYGIGCEWHNRDTRGQVSIAFLTKTGSGLSGAYAANQRGEYAYFKELPDIEGYPAVSADVEDRRPRGICIVFVGATDKVVAQISLYLSQANVGQKNPCDMAADVAGMALRTMKEGA